MQEVSLYGKKAWTNFQELIDGEGLLLWNNEILWNLLSIYESNMDLTATFKCFDEKYNHREETWYFVQQLYFLLIKSTFTFVLVK